MRPLLPARSTASPAPTPPGNATVTATSVGTIDAAVPKLCTGTDFPERPLASRKRAGSALAAPPIDRPSSTAAPSSRCRTIAATSSHSLKGVVGMTVDASVECCHAVPRPIQQRCLVLPRPTVERSTVQQHDRNARSETSLSVASSPEDAASGTGPPPGWEAPEASHRQGRPHRVHTADRYTCIVVLLGALDRGGKPAALDRGWTSVGKALHVVCPHHSNSH